jgi:hypothetical protein
MELIPEGQVSTRYRPKRTLVNVSPVQHKIRDVKPIDERLPQIYSEKKIEEIKRSPTQSPCCSKYSQKAKEFDRMMELFIKNQTSLTFDNEVEAALKSANGDNQKFATD